VTTHHLFFDDGSSENGEFKVNPPLRDPETKDKLYKAFANGKISMFGTDHAPHTIDEKRRTYEDAPSGIPGVETYVPIMMDLVKRGRVQIKELVRMASTAPAEAFSINKGKIAIGYDADLMIFDMRNTKKIKERDMHSKAGYTVYEGWDAIFPDTVIIRGEIQLKGGELCGGTMGRNIND
jgi:dihydroorotase